MVCLRCQLSFLFCLISSTCFAQVSLVSEVMDVRPFGTTHRVYFQADSGAEVLSLFASETHPMQVVSTASFHQELGQGSILPMNGLLTPGSDADSWFTIGEPSVASASSVGGTDWNNALASFDSGGGFSCSGDYGGAFYLTPGTSQGVVSDSGLLLGQFTSPGIVSVQLNVQWRPYGAQSAVESTNLTLTLLPADAGCTDSNALNFDATAVEEDGSCTYASNGFSGLAWEQVGTSDSGTPVYRVWADFANPNEQVVSVFGNEMVPLVVSSSAAFEQVSGGGVLPLGMNSDDILVQEDSWVTIGTDQGGGSTQTVGLTTALFESGSGLLSDPQFGGAWFVVPGSSANAFPDASGRVLLAQLTTAGLVQFQASLAYINGDEILQEVVGLSLTFPAGVSGCLDSLACNFNPAATLSANCLMEDALGVCGGGCEADADQDGVCDNDEVLGCDDVNAINYDATVTENDGSCLFAPFDPDTTGFLGLSYALTAEDVIQGTKTYRVYAEFDGFGFELISIFGEPESPMRLASEAGFFQSSLGGPLANAIPGGNLFEELEADSWLTIGGENAPTASSLQSIGIDFSAFESGGDLLVGAPVGGAIFVVPGGQPSATSDSTGGVLIGQFTTAGQVDVTFNLQFKTPNGEVPDVRGVNMIFPEEVTGCTDPESCNLDAFATLDDGSCDYPEGFPNHVLDCAGECVSDLDEDGICDADEIPGCTDPGACNYQLEATDEDGSCSSPDSLFGSSEFDCDGNCLEDADEDGTCDALEVGGCTNPQACNYSSAATEEDGSCEYLTCAGCLDVDACNYDAAATIGSNDCVFADEVCTLCVGGAVQTVDADEDGVCDNDEYTGCTEPAACNYDPLVDAANSINVDCVYPVDIFGTEHVTCDGVCIADQDGDGVCDPDEIPGCTYPQACNFSADASQEDGSCVFAEPLRTCEGDCLLDLNNDGVCDDLSDFGCTYSEAYNYDTSATVDNGSCVFPQGACQADLNSDGTVTIPDLLEFLVYFTTTCE